MLTYAQIDKDVLKSMEPPGKKWFMCIAVSLTALAMGMYALYIQVTGGLEISGISKLTLWLGSLYYRPQKLCLLGRYCT